MRDAVSRAGRAAQRSARAVCRPAGIAGGGLELAWIAAHIALYPLGVLAEKRREDGRYSLTGLPPVQRGLVIGDVEAAGTPILLVHGLIDNRTIFTRLRRSLRRRGFGRVYTFNYSPLAHDVRAVARWLGVEVERMCAETGYERVHVVGHSLGGLVARYYVQRLGGDARVHTLVTLGSPHAGTYAAHLLPSQICRQLRPNSALIRELAEPARCRTRFLAFCGELDQLIVPQGAARLDHPDLIARNVLRPGVGHMSLPIDGAVIHEISTTLAHLDTDGATVTPGVTPIEAVAGRRADAVPADRTGPRPATRVPRPS